MIFRNHCENQMKTGEENWQKNKKKKPNCSANLMNWRIVRRICEKRCTKIILQWSEVEYRLLGTDMICNGLEFRDKWTT